ncbi:MAG: complex I subunit 5 family protein [Thermoleophilaceae bacterium]
MTDLIPIAVVIPLTVAAALAVFARLVPRVLADIVALLAATATTVLAGLTLAKVADGLDVYWLGGWHPRRGVAIGVDLAVDQVGASLALLVCVLMVAALLFAWHYLEADEPYFHVLMLVFLAGMVGFAYSGDLFNMFVFFELMGVAAYALAGYKVDKAAPLEGSLNFAITNSIGAFLVLTGIGLLYGRTGALNLAQMGTALEHAPADGLIVVAFALVVTGFLVKAAVVPFHFWLADAYAVAPTPVCILFAGAMSELGLYGVSRVYFTVFDGPLGPHVADLRAVFVAAGVATALLGAAMCLAQDHLKRMLAFATVSYMGLFLIGGGLLSADGIAAAAVYVAADGLVKAALFTCIGILQHRKGHVSESRLQGRALDLPFTGAAFFTGALALAALPPFGVFLGKSMLDDALIEHGYDWVIAVVVLTSMLTGAATLRAGARVFFGWGMKDEGDIGSAADEEAESESGGPHDRTPAVMFLPIVALLAGSLAIGVWPGLAKTAEDAAARFVDHHGYIASVMRGAPAALPKGPPSHAPGWYDWMYAGISVAGALTLAALGLWRDRLGRGFARAAASLENGFLHVRLLHSGRIGDYVTFLLAGVAVFGGVFGIALR